MVWNIFDCIVLVSKISTDCWRLDLTTTNSITSSNISKRHADSQHWNNDISQIYEQFFHVFSPKLQIPLAHNCSAAATAAAAAKVLPFLFFPVTSTADTVSSFCCCCCCCCCCCFWWLAVMNASHLKEQSMWSKLFSWRSTVFWKPASIASIPGRVNSESMPVV